MADNIQDNGAVPFMIEKYALMPSEPVVAPRGRVLHVDFAGNTAYAWVQHHPEAPQDMQLLAMPTGGPFSLETDPLFHDPIHVGSFMKTDKTKLLPIAFHVFMFMPKNSGAIILTH